jgi:hypothetical protein
MLQERRMKEIGLKKGMKKIEIRDRRKRMTQMNNGTILNSVYINQSSHLLHVLALRIASTTSRSVFSGEGPFCASGSCGLLEGYLGRSS